MKRLLLLFPLAMGMLFAGCDQTSRDQLRALNAIRKGDHAGAVAAYTRILGREEVMPDSMWAITCLMRGNVQADWFKQSGDSTHLELALADFDTALAIDPDNWRGLLIRFRTLSQAGRHEEAFRDAHRLWKHDPSNSKWAWWAAGELSFLKRREEAIALLDSALLLHAEDPRLLDTKATQLVLLKRINEAIPVVNILIELEPGDPDHFRLRSLAHRLDGNIEAAIEDMNRAIELGDSFSYNFETRASLYLMFGDTVRARTDSLVAESMKAEI
ncbi:tetratricopeptide repeat protein [bacterium]|nr:tetratricopeptide repeat protein [bacterium]